MFNFLLRIVSFDFFNWDLIVVNSYGLIFEIIESCRVCDIIDIKYIFVIFYDILI